MNIEFLAELLWPKIDSETAWATAWHQFHAISLYSNLNGNEEDHEIARLLADIAGERELMKLRVAA